MSQLQKLSEVVSRNTLRIGLLEVPLKKGGSFKAFDASKNRIAMLEDALRKTDGEPLLLFDARHNLTMIN